MFSSNGGGFKPVSMDHECTYVDVNIWISEQIKMTLRKGSSLALTSMVSPRIRELSLRTCGGRRRRVLRCAGAAAMAWAVVTALVLVVVAVLIVVVVAPAEEGPRATAFVITGKG
jgi:hypothetical protein